MRDGMGGLKQTRTQQCKLGRSRRERFGRGQSGA